MDITEPLFLGIDGGGTGCRVLLTSGTGSPLGFGLAGPANIMTDFQTAHQNILEACKQAFSDAQLPIEKIGEAKAVLGLAGANIGNYASTMKAELPFADSKIVTDALISLQGAIGNRNGAAAIIGTGSVFICKKGKEIKTVGGWGFTVGDLGSGARLGRELLQEALLVFDGIHQGSELTQLILRRFQNNPQTIVEYAHEAKPGQFGELTPLIFEYADLGDQTANTLISKAVHSIEETLEVIATGPDDPLCLLGGLGNKYEKFLRPGFLEKLTIPAASAVEGAAAMAKQVFSPLKEAC